MAAVFACTSSTTQTETEFDYEGVKKKYMRQIELYYFNRKLPTNAPWTKKVIDKIKSTIKEGIRLKEIGYPSQLPKYRIMDKYEVYTEDGKEKLMFKRANPKDRIIEIVAAEECFDIIVDAHLKTDHGGYEKVMKTLRSKYSIPKTSIDFLTASCNVCSANKSAESRRRAGNKIPQVFHARGQVNLINMNQEPDHEFRYILCYLDRFTKYMLLRPLVTNSFNEVAMELLKIFLDIGPPEKLETYDRVYFGKVLSLVREVNGRFHNISLMLPVKLPEISANHVKDMLKKWQQQSGSRNWAMGCYVVQWESNSTVTGDNKSPYESVFNIKPWYASPSKNKSLYKRGDSNNNASSQSNDCASIDVLDDGDIIIPTDSEDEKASNTSEVAEITEENGDVIATIPLKAPIQIETSTLQTAAKSKTPVNKNTFSMKDVIIEQPMKVVGNPTTGKSVKLKITEDVDDIPASMIIKSPEDSLEFLPGNSKCHVCKTLIVQPYICVTCNRFVHLFCSDRLMKQDVPLTVLNVTCTPCTILAKRKEVIDQKLKEMDIDSHNGDIVLKGNEMVSKRKKIE